MALTGTQEITPGVTAAAAARSVVVRIGDKRLLDDVTIELRVGEVLALVGPNGAGKSTLLAVLAGDQPVSTGRVTVGDRLVGDWPAVALARLRSVLPQRNPVAFPFDVRSVVEMGRSPWRGTDAEDEDDAEVALALAQTELTHLANRPYSQLSGGEQARTALARVLVQRTGILLLDEPTAALDVRHQEQVMALARQRAAGGTSVLVVLHDLGLAAAHADRVAVLADGRLAAVGPPEEVCTAELLSQVYRYPVEVFPHPRTGRPVVLPIRDEERT